MHTKRLKSLMKIGNKRKVCFKKSKSNLSIRYDYIQAIYNYFLLYDFDESGYLSYNHSLQICRKFVPNLSTKTFVTFFNQHRINSRRGQVVSFSSLAPWLFFLYVENGKYMRNRIVRSLAAIKAWVKHKLFVDEYRSAAKRKIVWLEENKCISAFEKEFRRYKAPRHTCQFCAKPFALYQHKFYHIKLHKCNNENHYKRMKTSQYTQLDLDLIKTTAVIFSKVLLE